MSAPDDPTLPTAAASPPDPALDESFDDEEQGPDSDQLRDLLRRASATAPPPPKRDVLAGVQSRLRTRSEGKFYADGWSTRESNPRGTYLITAAVMLLLLVVAYWALVPGDIGLSPLERSAERIEGSEAPQAPRKRGVVLGWDHARRPRLDPDAGRRTPDAERRTPNAERRSPDAVVRRRRPSCVAPRSTRSLTPGPPPACGGPGGLAPFDPLANAL